MSRVLPRRVSAARAIRAPLSVNLWQQDVVYTRQRQFTRLYRRGLHVAETKPVGKKELAATLGWSRPTLDKLLRIDPNFPVISRGNQRGGWSFRLNDVRSYIARGLPRPPRPRGAKSAKLPPLDGSPRIVGKQALAKLLGWSRPTLDARLKSDAAFPVLHRGKTHGPWKFELAAVAEHLRAEMQKRGPAT